MPENSAPSMLAMDPADQQAYPYAVVIDKPDQQAALHFASKGTAALYSSLFDDDEVKRYVLNVDTGAYMEVERFLL